MEPITDHWWFSCDDCPFAGWATTKVAALAAMQAHDGVRAV
jgi:hypothetical protein